MTPSILINSGKTQSIHLIYFGFLRISSTQSILSIFETKRKFAKKEKRMTLKEKAGNLNANHVGSSDKILCFDLIFLLENRRKFNAKNHTSVCSWMKKDWEKC
jgi:hypothetical protein